MTSPMSRVAPQASVIIPMFNAADHIEEQLLGLSRQQTDVSWELILADNGCTDDTLGIVERIVPRIPAPVRVVDASARRGAPAARNAGGSVALGEFLLFIDQDDVVDDHWLQEMSTALREYPFVGGALDMRALNDEERFTWREPACETSLPHFAGRPFVPSCNCGIATAAYRTVGGFPEDFIYGGEDLDLSLKMEAYGAQPAFAERAVVRYRYRATARAMLEQSWKYGKGAGAVYRLHKIEPPTFLDLIVNCYRSIESGLRLRSHGRRPVRPAVDLAFAIGEASIVWREPAFWAPTFRAARPQKPWPLQIDRLRRVRGLVSRAVSLRPRGRA